MGWGLGERDDRELSRRLAQAMAGLRHRNAPATERDLVVLSGWVCSWLEDPAAYRRLARDQVVACLRMATRPRPAPASAERVVEPIAPTARAVQRRV